MRGFKSSANLSSLDKLRENDSENRCRDEIEEESSNIRQQEMKTKLTHRETKRQDMLDQSQHTILSMPGMCSRFKSSESLTSLDKLCENDSEGRCRDAIKEEKQKKVDEMNRLKLKLRAREEEIASLENVIENNIIQIIFLVLPL